MKRRPFSFLMLAVVLLLSLYLLPNRVQAATVASGTCGDNLTWILDDAGHLTISGMGWMEDYSFYENPAPWGTEIKTVTIEKGVTSIGDYAFSYCTSLTSITIPSSVTSIGDLAFCDCSRLTSITIPSSVTSIGDLAFCSCSSLTSITIPSSVTNIGFIPFTECASMQRISVDSNNPFYSSDASGVLFNKNKTTLLEYPSGKYGDYVIPNSVTRISSDAFYFCINLTSITIPSSVTRIGYSPFRYCVSMQRISVDSNNRFYSSDASGALFNKSKTELLSYPSGRKGAYTIPNSVTIISESAFEGCSYLTSVAIPNSVTSIGDHAFLSCSSLRSVTIPGSVTRIGDYMFHGCSSLTSVTIPSSVTIIGESAFDGCSSLTSVAIPNSVTSIGDHAFLSCSSLTSVTIPGSVTSIGDNIFAQCSSLTSVTIPSSITSIGNGVFYECLSLTSITIPDSVTSIGIAAFAGCSSLNEIRFKGAAPSIDEYAFYDITTTAYYPTGNSTWTADVMQDYGGDITWVSYAPDKYLNNVHINKVIPHKTGNILYWDAVDGADIYQIYRLNGSNWELLKNTRSLGYKDETAKVGVKHYYKIVARNGDAKSDIKTTVSASAIRPDTKLGNVTIYKTIGHSSGNILYWNAVDGAKLYQVYRLNGTTWELLKNTGSLGYKDETAPKGVACYYKIVARNGDVKSDIRTTTSTRVVRAK